MKNIKMKLVVSSALALVSSQVFAALEPLVAAPTGSAYINCFNDGRVTPASTANDARNNFGSSTNASSNGVCEITGISNDASSPKTGYSIVTSATRTIPSVTGGSTSIGQLIERIWRKPAATAPVTATDMCIFGAKVSNLSNTDHDSGTSGTQWFEVNDLARGGFSGSGTVNVGYFIQAVTASPVYRVGRSFTSVQHRAYTYNTLADKRANGTGYLDLPTIGGSSTLAINGNDTVTNTGLPFLATDVASVTTASEQDAQVNSNWVDFTLDTVYQDDDGSTNVISAMTYVEAPCNSDSAAVINGASGWKKTGAIRLRQTAQENTTFKQIEIDGYAPPGATVP
jgi:hypothetical protein